MSSNASSINVVWIKRDLRTMDHEPLYAAEANGQPYLILFLFEPKLIHTPDVSLRHLQWQYHSALDMRRQLALQGRTLHIVYGEATEVLAQLADQFAIGSVFSYQETGTRSSWDRDRRVKGLLNERGIRWQEFQRDGVIRGRRHRRDWVKAWYAAMHKPVLENTYSPHLEVAWNNAFPLPTAMEQRLAEYPAPFQPAGERYARRYLQSFLQGRGDDYSRFISKPADSRRSCSRLSPYLAWGNISVRSVYQQTLKTMSARPRKKPYQAFLTRLRWHCHFIQKFEADCSYEVLCINRGYEHLDYRQDPEHLAAWKEGRTGVPLVDACMRCLHTTGWINFRMRALLVSFLCHHLFIDWKEGVYHLAQLFLDYEPGIHYTQFQMQAGTTGINTLRIYNPVKNALEHDPQAVFIYTWIPELRKLPVPLVYEPWRLTLLEQSMHHFVPGRDYPPPIVDIEKGAREARDKIWALRKDANVQSEAQRILQVHVIPRPG
jgi:deoxyribodipyrimidine photo-lyase